MAHSGEPRQDPPPNFETLLRTHFTPAQIAAAQAERAAAERQRKHGQLLAEVDKHNLDPTGTPVEELLSPRDAALARSFLTSMQSRQYPGIVRMWQQTPPPGPYYGSFKPEEASGYHIGFTVSFTQQHWRRLKAYPYQPLPCLRVFLCDDARLRTTDLEYSILRGSIPRMVIGETVYYQNIQPAHVGTKRVPGYMAQGASIDNSTYDITTFRPGSPTLGKDPDYWVPPHDVPCWVNGTLEQRLLQIARTHALGIEPHTPLDQ